MQRMDLEQFLEYCRDFYHEDVGIYQIATDNELRSAVEWRIVDPSYEGDSIDREAVRDRILEVRRNNGGISNFQQAIDFNVNRLAQAARPEWIRSFENMQF